MLCMQFYIQNEEENVGGKIVVGGEDCLHISSCFKYAVS